VDTFIKRIYFAGYFRSTQY